MGRLALCSGALGTHNGLPVTVIVSTTLQDLERAAGVAVTGGGSLLPMADLIRMAAHARHYLYVFDKHTGESLYLGRTRRLASPAQRIVLHARDRGCTRPGCTAPGYWCQAHHAVADWNNGGQTNVDHLTLACPTDHRMLDKTDWSTRKNAKGQTNGSRPPTSTPDSGASTATTTPNGTCCPKTTTGRESCYLSIGQVDTHGKQIRPECAYSDVVVLR